MRNGERQKFDRCRQHLNSDVEAVEKPKSTKKHLATCHNFTLNLESFAHCLTHERQLANLSSGATAANLKDDEYHGPLVV